jgi:hypothetical protein
MNGRYVPSGGVGAVGSHTPAIGGFGGVYVTGARKPSSASRSPRRCGTQRRSSSTGERAATSRSATASCSIAYSRTSPGCGGRPGRGGSSDQQWRHWIRRTSTMRAVSSSSASPARSSLPRLRASGCCGSTSHPRPPITCRSSSSTGWRRVRADPWSDASTAAAWRSRKRTARSCSRSGVTRSTSPHASARSSPGSLAGRRTRRSRSCSGSRRARCGSTSRTSMRSWVSAPGPPP